jgi:hypothetical protein
LLRGPLAFSSCTHFRGNQKQAFCLLQRESKAFVLRAHAADMALFQGGLRIYQAVIRDGIAEFFTSRSIQECAPKSTLLSPMRA